MSQSVLDIDPLSYLARLAAFSYWTLLLWPVLATAAVLAFRWRRLERRAVFLILGCLTCYGAMFVAGQLHAHFYLYMAANTPTDRLLRALTEETLGITLFGVLICCLPLFLLERQFRSR